MRRLFTLGFLLAAGTAGGAWATSPSAQAQLGRHLFFDPSLSASGRLSCASCHDPTNAYAAPRESAVVMKGGANLHRPGIRAVPSLRYLSESPRFARHSYVDVGSEREDLGPAGGLMLDGRADNLREQALLPLLDPAEMGNSSVQEVAARLRRASYAQELAQARELTRAEEPAQAQELAQAPALTQVGEPPRAPSADAQSLVTAATAALERFELEDPSFHPYDSRFDQHLAGEPTLTPDELEGLRLFTDPNKGNCAACHSVTTGPGGSPPVFTDHSYHALGVPRNPRIPVNADPRFFDLGLCGPRRADLRDERQYCGYFKTPTLRNVARRRFFFHNGRFTTLDDVMHFYVERDTAPRRWYPFVAGKLQKFDDMPARYRENVNISDAPLNRGRGASPALDDREIAKVVAFLGTLSDQD